ncbi:MAG: hypothetical protein Q7P63_17715 [Verrucomicrobiota bacterium JB022]|nr:hypothetical protein [Verrucomicrobiota bacterium JB022]
MRTRWIMALVGLGWMGMAGLAMTGCRQEPLETPTLQYPADLARKLERKFPPGTAMANVTKWMFREAFELESWTDQIVTYKRVDRPYIDGSVTYHVYVYHENGFVQGFEVDRADSSGTGGDSSARRSR